MNRIGIQGIEDSENRGKLCSVIKTLVFIIKESLLPILFYFELNERIYPVLCLNIHIEYYLSWIIFLIINNFFYNIKDRPSYCFAVFAIEAITDWNRVTLLK